MMLRFSFEIKLKGSLKWTVAVGAAPWWLEGTTAASYFIL